LTQEEQSFRDWLETQPRYRQLLKPTPTADIAREFARAGSEALGAYSNAAAGNRGVQLEADIARAELQQAAERDYFDQVIRREQSGREGQRQSWDLMNRAAYVESATGKAPGFAGKYSRNITPPSDAQRSTAAIVREEMARRLAEGNPLPTPQRVGTDVQVQQPGRMERVSGIAAPIAGIASRIPAAWWQKIGRWIS
jgi:hypothetical protein